MQEGAGDGGSCSWMQDVLQIIKQEAARVPMTSLPRNLQSIDREHPSIFMPPQRQVAVAAEVAQTASQQPLDQAGATASSSCCSSSNSVMVLAVGPYHHRPESPPARPLITRAKKCAIVELLTRREFGLDTVAFLGWAHENCSQARGCYERDSVTMRPIELAEMHLLDGCLVLFAIFLLRSRKPSMRRDQVLYPSCLGGTRGRTAQDFTNLSADITRHMKQTRLNLLLLGNQIPFFVLQELHRQLEGTFFQGINHSIQELALSCFEEIRPSPSRSLAPNTVVHHLLHLFHWSRVPSDAMDPSSPQLLGEPESNLPCATWFEDSHISLSSTHAAARGALHMAFQRNMLGARGVLRVPALHIHSYSGLVLHNLIAFEQRRLSCGLAVTTYSICMAGLLQSEADAKLLRNKGILAHTHETDREIVDLFRGLAHEYRHASYSRDLLDLCEAVEAHHHGRAARAVKWVALRCFPRQTITFFVILGALISIATLINTSVSVYRFYHPYKQE